MRTSIHGALALGYYQPPAYYPPPYRLFRPIRPFLPTIALALAGMILIIVAIFTPWYGIYTKTPDYESKGEMYFNEIRGEGKSHGTTATSTQSWSQYTNSYKSANNNKEPRVPILYLITEIIVIVALVMAILAFAAAIVNWAGRGLVSFARKLTLFLLVAAVLGFVALGVFAATHTWAVAQDSTSNSSSGPHKSLIGSQSEGGEETIWTLSIGWFVALAASILLISAFGKARHLPQPVAAYPYPYATGQSYNYYQPPPQQPSYEGYQPPSQPPSYGDYRPPSQPPSHDEYQPLPQPPSYDDSQPPPQPPSYDDSQPPSQLPSSDDSQPLSRPPEY